MKQYRVILPDASRTTVYQSSIIPPFGTIVYLEEDSYDPTDPGGAAYRLYEGEDRPGVRSHVWLMPEEVEAVDTTKRAQDVSIEVGPAKATFSGSDVPAGYIVAAVVSVVALGIGLVGIVKPEVFGLINFVLGK